MTSPAKMMAFLDSEIKSLRARIGTKGNAVQEDKLAMLQAIRDYIRNAAEADRRMSA